jgi:hypothetical protein
VRVVPDALPILNVPVKPVYRPASKKFHRPRNRPGPLPLDPFAPNHVVRAGPAACVTRVGNSLAVICPPLLPHFHRAGRPVGRPANVPWWAPTMTRAPAAHAPRLTRTTSRFLLVPVIHGQGFT